MTFYCPPPTRTTPQWRPAFALCVLLPSVLLYACATQSKETTSGAKSFLCDEYPNQANSGVQLKSPTYGNPQAPLISVLVSRSEGFTDVSEINVSIAFPNSEEERARFKLDCNPTSGVSAETEDGTVAVSESGSDCTLAKGADEIRSKLFRAVYADSATQENPQTIEVSAVVFLNSGEAEANPLVSGNYLTLMDNGETITSALSPCASRMQEAQSSAATNSCDYSGLVGRTLECDARDTRQSAPAGAQAIIALGEEGFGIMLNTPVPVFLTENPEVDPQPGAQPSSYASSQCRRASGVTASGSQFSCDADGVVVRYQPSNTALFPFCTPGVLDPPSLRHLDVRQRENGSILGGFSFVHPDGYAEEYFIENCRDYVPVGQRPAQ